MLVILLTYFQANYMFTLSLCGLLYCSLYNNITSREAIVTYYYILEYSHILYIAIQVKIPSRYLDTWVCGSTVVSLKYHSILNVDSINCYRRPAHSPGWSGYTGASPHSPYLKVDTVYYIVPSYHFIPPIHTLIYSTLQIILQF